MSLPGRIKKVIKDSGLILPVVAKRMGVGRNTIVRYRDGDNSPSVEFLEKMAEEFKVNPKWLILGEGQQLTQEHPFISGRPASLSAETLAFTLFMMQKVPESFRKLPLERHRVLLGFLYQMFQEVTREELVILQSVIKSWFEEFPPLDETVKAEDLD
jgi:transcriptional regulator with XRE-family HTH domain